jgi:hypothetical protein
MTVEDAVKPQLRRRLSDKIEEAFDQACTQGQLEVAACMLKGMDMALLGRQQSWDQRQAGLALVRSMQERLQSLRDVEAASLGRSWQQTGPRGPENRATYHRAW